MKPPIVLFIFGLKHRIANLAEKYLLGYLEVKVDKNAWIVYNGSIIHKRGVDLTMKRVVVLLFTVVILLGACAQETQQPSVAEPETDEPALTSTTTETTTIISQPPVTTIITTISPPEPKGQNWKKAYSDYLFDETNNKENVDNIHIHDINGDDIPEIIRVYQMLQVDIIYYVNDELQVLQLKVAGIRENFVGYLEDTQQIFVIYALDRSHYRGYHVTYSFFDWTSNGYVEAIQPYASYFIDEETGEHVYGSIEGERVSIEEALFVFDEVYGLMEKAVSFHSIPEAEYSTIEEFYEYLTDY